MLHTSSATSPVITTQRTTACQPAPEAYFWSRLSIGPQHGGKGDGKGQLVVLRVETASAREAKVAASVVAFATLLGVIAVVTLTVLKLTKSHKEPFQLIHGDAYNATAISLAGTLLLVLGIRTSIFGFRIFKTWQRGDIWKQRRKRVAGLAFAAACVQIINLFFWFLPNTYIVAGLTRTPPDCRWFSDVTNASGVLRWTCWNTLLLLFLIMGHSLLEWRPRNVSKDSPDYHRLLVLDAPIWIHFWKLPLWVAAEICAVFIVSPNWDGSKTEGPVVPQAQLDGREPIDCRLWDWSAPCNTDGPTQHAVIGMATMMALYLLTYIIYVASGIYQLRRRPFTSVRAASMLLQLQLQGVLLVFKFIFITTVVLWFVEVNTCWSYITTWTGLLPLQVVGAALVWQLCWLYMPKDPKSDMLMQAVLQEFAWTEASLPDRLAERLAYQGSGHKLDEEPMFCLETAMKLQRWSTLAYTKLGQEALKEHASASVNVCLLNGGGCAEDPERGEGDGAGHSRQGSGHGSWSAKTLAPEGSGNGRAAPGLVELWSDHMRNKSTVLERSDTPPNGLRHNRQGSIGGTSTTGSEYTEDESSREGDGDEEMSMPPGEGDQEELGELEEQALHGKTRKGRKRKPMKKVNVREQLAKCMQLFDLEDIHMFWDPTLETKAIMGWSRKTVVLAFRGTASITNALYDLRVWRTVHPPKRGIYMMGSQPLVHSGFYKAWVARGLNTQVLSFLQELYDSGQVDEDARVCVTGHSLGGALAVLAAHDIGFKLRTRPHRLQVYTYGCAYPGNHAFCREFDERIHDCWHIIHGQDPIPKAGKFLILSKRPGHRVLINRRGEIVVRPNPLELQIQSGQNVSHHWLLSYGAAMTAVCLAQYSTTGIEGGIEGVQALWQLPWLQPDLKKAGIDGSKGADLPPLHEDHEGDHGNGDDCNV
ncbi:hypothetical protein WJX73_006949 [Symbiochloris irregularis]|uniref:Fungal lipase-type domain-containing protein n=1 Tax=Symbiochloris irregularis TaxID=706552 RepID=A0AAW1P6S9_9CHLO